MYVSELTKIQLHLKQAIREGINLWIRGEYDAALNHFQSVRHFFDESEPLYLRHYYSNLGITYGSLEQQGRAVECFKQALTIKPCGNDEADIKAVESNLATSLVLAGLADEAMPYLESVEIYFTDQYDFERVGETLETRARAYTKLGQHRLALFTANRAVTVLMEHSEDSNAIGRAIRTLWMCWETKR